ncbi:MAG TPA: HAD family hydrolase, partial [Candidatus Binatia bacterium]
MKQAANPYPTESAISSGGSAIFPRDRFIRDKPPVDLNSPRISEAEFNASLLRCRYLEACRQRDLAGRETGWRARIAVTAPYCFRHVLRASAWAKDTLADGVRTIRKLPDIATLCTSADVVSFDVFNTLLSRTVEPPDYLKRLAANYAAQLYAERGYPLTADLFLYLRDESEHRQRRIAQSRGWDTECKLSEVIYEVLFRLFGSEVAEIETATLLEHELKIEVDHLRVVEGVKDLLQNLRSQGKRIIVTSDTYLEPGHLQVIFAQLGIDRWIDAIYASSEHLLGKYSGRLFQTILSAEAIIAARLIHIGDTYESDIRGAVKAGIPAVFLFDIGRLRRRRRLSRESTQIDMVQAKFHKVAPKRAAALPILNSHRNEESELYQIGRDILGPAFTLFVVDVIEESHRVGAADIYYLAREGLLFRELHEILTGHLHQVKCLPPMRHHYLFVSRLATSLPAIRELSQRELHLALYRDRNATLAECISAFGLNPAE